MITDFIVYIINKIIYIVGVVLNTIFGLLPNTPFTISDTSVISEYMGYLNWIIPIDKILIVTISWLTAITLYYVYQIVLRWIKAIE